MASYGPIYEFAFDSQNGADILIVVSKKDYDGEVIRRPLGRAPLLKRENNDNIYGTSLEIYAECKVDGEYAEFYTSSADEFKVEVYKDTVRIWSGFISPELYSEPDIAPPYDVQIIATDGLGELKNYDFKSDNASSLQDHFTEMLSHTGLSLEVVLASALKYYNAESASLPQNILDLRLDLSHENSSSCYDALQHMLSALNASISQFEDKWFIFRETDFIHQVSEQGLDVFKPGQDSHILGVDSFGSATSAAWWPIGHMSASIEPAKNRLTLTSPNHYKDNVLGPSWIMENGASYDEADAAYVLPDEGSCIVQKLDFEDDRVEYRLALRISARNVGAEEEDQSLGIQVVIDGRGSAGERKYWLVQSAPSDGRNLAPYLWKTSEGEIEAQLAMPSDSDTSADAQDVDIILPLYRNGNRSFMAATSVEITIFNPSGIHDIYVYGVSLSKYDQFEGYQVEVALENGAREEASSIDLTILDGSKAPTGGPIFMSGIPLLPDENIAITAWGIGSSASEDYLSLMAKDYSKKVALPRMSYRGVMNVPRTAMPVLFVRDNTYYFPRTYSYNLLNDELEVDLISIPAADVTASSVVVSQISQSKGSFSSTGSGGSGSGSGGGAGTGSDLWNLDSDGNIVTDRKVTINNSLVVEGDVSSGEEEGGNAVLSITGIKLNGTTYYDTDGDGIIDLGAIISGGGGLTSVSWNDIQGKPTSLSAFANDVGFITAASLANYQPLATAINTGNIGNYAPSPTGEGASGKWNIQSLALYAPWKSSASVVETAEALRYFATIPTSFASWCTGYNNAVINISRFSSEGYSSQLGFSGGGMYYRHQNNGTWGDWKTVAFTDSTVANATKLQTARSLWGQSFDGAADIGGDLTINNGSNIMGKHTNGSGMALVGMGSNNSAYFGYGTIEKSTHTYIDGSNIYMRTGSSRANRIVIDSSGRVGINMDSPSYRFDVNGDIGVNAIIFKNNSGGFYHKDGDANSQVLGYNMTNKLLTIGIGTSARGYETRVRGNIITLYYGTSGVKGFTMDENGNATFEKDVVVKGDIASA